MPTLFRSYPKRTPKFSLITIFWFPLMWLPAFGYLTEHAYTWVFMRIGMVLVGFSVLFYLLHAGKKRAYLTPFLFGCLSLVTAVIYFVRLTDFVRDEFGLSHLYILVLDVAVLGILSTWAFRYFRSLLAELVLLRTRGLLRKYDILNEERGVWDSERGLPGLDGSSPEERRKAALQKAGWLLLIPASGIAFYLIRTWLGSITWILLAINLGMCCIFSMSVFGTLPLALQLLAWEKELGKPILTRVEKVD